MLVVEKVRKGRSYPTVDELRHMYIEERMTREAIGERYGVPVGTVTKWLGKHDIKRYMMHPNGKQLLRVVEEYENTWQEWRRLKYDPRPTMEVMARRKGVTLMQYRKQIQIGRALRKRLEEEQG